MRLFASAGKICSYWRHSTRRGSSSSRCWPGCRSRSRCARTVVHFRPCDRRGAARRCPSVVTSLHVDVEGGLVELDHVDAVLLQRARLLVEQLGERHRQLHLVAVVPVGDGVDDGHRPGHGDLDLSSSYALAAPRASFWCDAALQRAAGRRPPAPSRRSGCCGCPSSPCARSRCPRRARGSRARSAAATARRR